MYIQELRTNNRMRVNCPLISNLLNPCARPSHMRQKLDHLSNSTHQATLQRIERRKVEYHMYYMIKKIHLSNKEAVHHPENLSHSKEINRIYIHCLYFVNKNTYERRIGSIACMNGGYSVLWS